MPPGYFVRMVHKSFQLKTGLAIKWHFIPTTSPVLLNKSWFHDNLLFIVCKKLKHPLQTPPFFAWGIIDSSIETAMADDTEAALITPSKAACMVSPVLLSPRRTRMHGLHNPFIVISLRFYLFYHPFHLNVGHVLHSPIRGCAFMPVCSLRLRRRLRRRILFVPC